MADEPKNEGKMSLSFGFKKKIETKVDKSKVIIEKVDEVEKEALNEVNETILTKKERKTELVIPLIKKNKWQLSSNHHNGEANQAKDEDMKLQERAVREIMKESAAFLDKSASDVLESEFENLAVPLLLKNKVPEGFETDDKLNVDLRPDEASQEDYDAVPVEAFGMAVLRGMGWDPKVGIGKTFKQNVKVLETNVRPKGLGLGATAPGPNEKPKQNHHSSKEAPLIVKVGAYVKIKGGSHKNKYGIIEGIDADNALCIIKFAIGGKIASIGEFNVEAVSKSEFSKYGRDLSRLTKAHEDLNSGSKSSKTQDPIENYRKRKKSPDFRKHLAESSSEVKKSRTKETVIKNEKKESRHSEHRSYQDHHMRKRRSSSGERLNIDSAANSRRLIRTSNEDRKEEKKRPVSPSYRHHHEHPRESDHKHHKKQKRNHSDSPELHPKKAKSHKEKHKKLKKEKHRKSKKEKRHRYKDDASSSSCSQ